MNIKIKRFFFLPLLISLFIQYSYSVPRGEQELVQADSWIYDSLNRICMEAETVNFSDNRPVSISQIKDYLYEIDYDSLSGAGRAEYDRIFRYFKQQNYSFGGEFFSVGFEPSVNLESYYKSNEKIDWVYDRYDKKGLFKAPMTISMGDYFTIKMDLGLQKNKGASSHHDNFVNIPFSPDDIDINFPDTGYLSAGKKISDKAGISFQIGRNSRSTGNSLNGSIIHSEYLTGATYAQFEAYSDKIKFITTTEQLNVDKYLYSHQLDVRLGKKLSLGAVESLVVNAPLELRYINPLIIFHGFAPWRDYGSNESHTGCLLGLKAQFVPFSGFKMYGNFAMTQFQTAYERTNWPDNLTPNGIGGQLGLSYSLPLGNGFLSFAGEGYYASPYLYIKESPNWTFVRTYAENIGDCAVFYEWTGSPFGPDTASCEFRAGYAVPSLFSVDFIYLFMARGEMSGDRVYRNINWGGTNTSGSENGYVDNWCYPNDDQENAVENRDKKTPSGTAEYVNRISLCCSYFLNDNISFTVQPSYVFIFNHDNVEGEFAGGFEIALSASVRLCRR